MAILPLLLIVLVLSGTPSYAEWVFVTTDGKGNTMYLDADSIRRKGNIAKVWVLLDTSIARETMEGVPFRSSRTLHQVDCGKERFRVVAFTLFSGNMGSGQLVASSQYMLEWERVPSEGSARRLLKLVCEK